MLSASIRLLDGASLRLSALLAWLPLAMALLTVFVVLLRYGFGFCCYLDCCGFRRLRRVAEASARRAGICQHASASGRNRARSTFWN